MHRESGNTSCDTLLWVRPTVNGGQVPPGEEIKEEGSEGEACALLWQVNACSHARMLACIVNKQYHQVPAGTTVRRRQCIYLCQDCTSMCQKQRWS